MQAGAFDAVLMDLQMPELDGLSAARMIRRLPSGQGSLPIIALTAHTMAQHQQKIADAGCDDFQEKPIFPFQNLLEKIKKHTVR